MIFPPDDDDVSDQDSDEDDVTGAKDINRLGKGILNQQVEVDTIFAEDFDENNYEEEVEATGDSDIPSKNLTSLKKNWDSTLSGSR